MKVTKLNQVAGSGKTTGLIKLIKENKDKKILFLTFSKFAIQDFEIRLRKDKVIPKDITFSTIHAMAVRNLKKYENFEIPKGGDPAVPSVARTMRMKYKDLYKFSSMYINGLRQQIKDDLKISEERQDVIWEGLVNIYEEYKEYPHNYIMYKFNQIFKEVANEFQYDVLMIDEAQDLSILQIEVIKKIIKENEDLEVHVVGDILQNIYRFRFSGPELLTEQITEGEDIKIKATTYRCSNTVIDRANRLIDVYYDTEKEQEKFKVKIEAYRDEEGKYTYCDKKTSSFHISEMIKNAIAEKSTLGILVRANYQIRDLIPFITEDIAKNVFIKESNIFDSLAVTAFDSLLNIKGLINIKRLTLDKVKKFLLVMRIYSYQKQLEFFNLIKNGTNVSTKNYTWKKYLKALNSCSPHTFDEFKENYFELIRESEIYKDNTGDTEAFISFLNNIESEAGYKQKVQIANRLHDKLNNNQNIIITTIHSSKGTEYDNIILYGMDYKIQDYIDEVKLLYVGVTRARNNILQVGKNELSSILT